MRLPLLLAAVSAALTLSACSLFGGDDRGDYEDVYRYTAYGEADEAVVAGTLRIVRLPNDVAGEPHRLQGDWALEADVPDVGPQDGEGTLAGTYEDTIEGTLFFIDLHPGMADDNVLLVGRFLDGGEGMEGTWTHQTLGGPAAAGRFEGVRTRRARLQHVGG